MQFYEKFLLLCRDRGITPSKAVLEIGMKKSAVTRWKAGGEPTDLSLTRIAEYFSVPVEYFNSDIKKEPTAQGGELSDDIKDLVELFQKAPAAYRAAALAVLRSAESDSKAPDAE